MTPTPAEYRELEHLGVKVTVTPSGGLDGAIVVMIDTEFEPDGSDAGPGLRVEINDGDVYTGVDYIPDMDAKVHY